MILVLAFINTGLCSWACFCIRAVSISSVKKTSVRTHTTHRDEHTVHTSLHTCLTLQVRTLINKMYSQAPYLDHQNWMPRTCTLTDKLVTLTVNPQKALWSQNVPLKPKWLCDTASDIKNNIKWEKKGWTVRKLTEAILIRRVLFLIFNLSLMIKPWTLF